MIKYIFSITFLALCLTMISCKGKSSIESEAFVDDEKYEFLEYEGDKHQLELLQDEDDLLLSEEDRDGMKPLLNEFNRINLMSKWGEIAVIEFTNEKRKGTTKLYYNDKQEVEKIVVREYDTEQESLNIYYLKEKEVFLMISQALVYNASVDSKEFSKDKSEYVKECNYFMNNELISIKSNQDCGAPFAQDYLKEVEKEIKEEVKRLLS